VLGRPGFEAEMKRGDGVVMAALIAEKRGGVRRGRRHTEERRGGGVWRGDRWAAPWPTATRPWHAVGIEIREADAWARATVPDGGQMSTNRFKQFQIKSNPFKHYSIQIGYSRPQKF
jgi:hypothetical protein